MAHWEFDLSIATSPSGKSGLVPHGLFRTWDCICRLKLNQEFVCCVVLVDDEHTVYRSVDNCTACDDAAYSIL